MSETAPQTPSAAALLYLFADRVIEPDTALSKGFQVPCTQARVKTTLLAADLFAISFWQLAEQQKIDLVVGKKTLMGMGRPQITATLRPGVAIPQPKTTPIGPEQLAAMGGQVPAGVAKMLEQYAPQIAAAHMTQELSFADAIIGGLASMQPTPVRDLIRDWFGSDVSDPQSYVVQHMGQEITDLGLVTGITQGGMFGTPTLVIDCAQRAALEAPAVELLTRWQAFRDIQQGLGPTLRDRCKAAIGSRTEGSDD